MRRNNEVRILGKLIRPFGLYIISTKKHRKIVTATGSIVYSFAGSPSCAHFAENTLADLIKMGLVSEELKRVKIR